MDTSLDRLQEYLANEIERLRSEMGEVGTWLLSEGFDDVRDGLEAEFDNLANELDRNLELLGKVEWDRSEARR